MKGFPELRARFRGALLRPGEEGYDEARRIWNGAIDRRPALIARCAGADDVAVAVRYARERDLPVSVRGGGHAVAGHAVCEDGLMIDLSLLKAVRVDPEARVAPGGRGAAVGRPRRRHPAARAGHHRRGHQPHRHRRPDPRRRARPPDAQARPDRRQPARGRPGHRRRRATPGRRRPRPRAALGAARRGRQLRHRHRLRVPAAPGGADRARGAGVLAAGGRRQGPAGPARLRPRSARRARHHRGHDAGPAAADHAAHPAGQAGRGPGAGLDGRPGGRAAGDRAPAGGRPARGRARPPGAVPGHPVDAGRRGPAGTPLLLALAPARWPPRLGGLPDEAIDALLDQVASVTSPFSQINGWAMGGAVSRVDPEATAVGEREVGFDLSFAAAWPPGDPDGERHTAWVRRGWEALAPHGVGVYVNFISDEGPAGVETAYGQRLKRLTALKDRYDPTNLFRMNANIPPSQPGRR